jgi:hypothetical protein
MPLTLHQLEAAVRESWGTETCDPADLPWSAERPSRGQCTATALVLNDLLGGELLMAEVVYDDGTHQGFHGWNRLAGGVDIDQTRDQFDAGETVLDPEVATRPDDRPSRVEDQYRELRRRVLSRLTAAAS